MTQAAGIVSVLTDFGIRDPFVGVMKAVMLSIDRDLRLVDLAHGARAQDLVEGEFFLSTSHRFFPTGTVHLVVVDPGVGTERKAIVAQTSAGWFVAPDNGVLECILGDARVRAVDVARHALTPLSRTFHGRDVFAPVAARLASGQLCFDDVGPEHGPVRLESSSIDSAGDEISGAVVSVDHFGNLITNIPGVEAARLAEPIVRLGGREVALRSTYGNVQSGTLVAVVNAYETVEVAVRNGSAAAVLSLAHGAPVAVRSGA